jgi:hypothetical protein
MIPSIVFSPQICLAKGFGERDLEWQKTRVAAMGCSTNAGLPPVADGLTQPFKLFP